MKRLTNFALFVLFLTTQTYGQKLIAVQNGNTPKFYTDLIDAVDTAIDGDTIYIPGGSFSGITVNKKLHLVGVGYIQDSTLVSGRTVIGGVVLSEGANNGSITGCYINVYCYSGCPPSISVGNVENYAISRCYINSGISFDLVSNNFLIAENIIGIHGPGCLYGGSHSIVLKGTNHIISNNIILGDINSQGNNNVFNNNLFLYSSTWCGIFSNNNDIFNNNIILGSKGSTSNCISRNNLGVFNNGVDGQNNQGINNYTIIDTDSIFIDFKLSTGWLVNSNFHLKENSPYLDAGTDGTDLGIYGGAYPWKEGSIPFNPHFHAATIAPKTDASGNLNIQIKVSAQDN